MVWGETEDPTKGWTGKDAIDHVKNFSFNTIGFGYSTISALVLLAFLECF